MFTLVETLDFQEPSTFPTANTVNYRGAVSAEADTLDLLGDLSIDVVFSSDTFHVAIGGFVAIDDAGNPIAVVVSGQLDIVNGEIDRTVDVQQSFPLAADLEGVLSIDGEQVTVEAFLLGDFFQNVEYMGGEIDGTITDASGIGVLSGDFYAAQN